MGYWETNREGVSFAASEGPQMIWGDAPADVMGDAVDAIVQTFTADVGRPPTKDEIRAGLEFNLGPRTDPLEVE